MVKVVIPLPRKIQYLSLFRIILINCFAFSLLTANFLFMSAIIHEGLTRCLELNHWLNQIFRVSMLVQKLNYNIVLLYDYNVVRNAATSEACAWFDVYCITFNETSQLVSIGDRYINFKHETVSLDLIAFQTRKITASQPYWNPAAVQILFRRPLSRRTAKRRLYIFKGERWRPWHYTRSSKASNNVCMWNEQYFIVSRLLTTLQIKTQLFF